MCLLRTKMVNTLYRKGRRIRHSQICGNVQGEMQLVAGDDSLTTALKEVREELGIILDPQNGRMIRHYIPCSNIECHGLIDVWLFRQNVDISTVILAPNETCNAMWASRDKINSMIDEGMFTTWGLCTYIDELLF